MLKQIQLIRFKIFLKKHAVLHMRKWSAEVPHAPETEMENLGPVQSSKFSLTNFPCRTKIFLVCTAPLNNFSPRKVPFKKSWRVSFLTSTINENVLVCTRSKEVCLIETGMSDKADGKETLRRKLARQHEA